MSKCGSYLQCFLSGFGMTNKKQDLLFQSKIMNSEEFTKAEANNTDNA